MVYNSKQQMKKVFIILMLSIAGCGYGQYTDSLQRGNVWYYTNDAKGLPVRNFYPKTIDTIFHQIRLMPQNNVFKKGYYTTEKLSDPITISNNGNAIYFKVKQYQINTTEAYVSLESETNRIVINPDETKYFKK